MPRSSRLQKDLRAIGKTFEVLAHHFQRIAPLLGEGAMAMARAQEPATRGRRSRRLTAAHRAALKIQGKYMGTLRGLKPGQQAKVKKIRAEKGLAAAIKAARNFAS